MAEVLLKIEKTDDEVHLRILSESTSRFSRVDYDNTFRSLDELSEAVAEYIREAF